MDRNSALTGDLQRIIQEQVPGMQVSLAHIIANPDKILYTKLGWIRRWIIPNPLSVS